MSNSKFLLVTAFCLLLGGTVCAADTFFVIDESDHVYGKGVHAFFDRDYEGAVTILLQVEEMKSNDPRPYYFLGLAYLRQKKTEQADRCFEKAAQLEYSGRTSRDYGVAESLRRIQGEERLRIEKIRSEERTNAQKREQQRQEVRYGRENTADRDTLRQLASQHQKEDLEALQKETNSFSTNVFGVKPMDPINTAEENVVVRRVETNPFGGVAASGVKEDVKEPVISDPTPPRERRSPVAAPPVRTERTFVNAAVGPGGEEDTMKRNSGQSDTVVSPAALIMNPAQGARAAAKEFGRGLGTFFSRRGNAE